MKGPKVGLDDAAHEPYPDGSGDPLQRAHVGLHLTAPKPPDSM